MSAALSAGAEGKGASAQNDLDGALKLLARAIEVLDSVGAPPELAARVQEALDAVAEYRSSGSG